VTGATEALTRALALELAPVRVNAVRPGPVRSSMWTDTVPDPEAVYDDFASRSPLGRIAEPEDIAAAYIFLMTSSNTTGTSLTSDAGTGLV
jgi:NAD(P)-dependent dehydrogenase (short-subunit alcohol dehydrogenase family)